MQARLFWSLWQELLLPFATCFTTPGWKRFVEWVTGLALNVEEHTITQSVLALNRPDDWKALETFAETGAWETDEVEDTLTRLLETAPGRLWHGFRVDAVDDTKVHRSSKDVWGTCTFYERSQIPGARAGADSGAHPVPVGCRRYLTPIRRAPCPGGLQAKRRFGAHPAPVGSGEIYGTHTSPLIAGSSADRIGQYQRARV